MKYFLLIFLLLPFLSQAQVKTKLYVSGPLATNVFRGPLGADSGLYIGSNCGDPNTIIPKATVGTFYNVYRGTFIYKDTCNNSVWTSNPDSSWSQLAGDNAYTTINQINDSTYIICHLSGSCDTISFSQGIPYMDTAYAINDSTTRYCKAGSCWDITIHGGGGGTTLELQTNGVDNDSQTLLNLKSGTNTTVTDQGGGDVEISSDDLDAFHTTTQLTDTSFTINRPNGTQDTVEINNLAPLTPLQAYTGGYGATAGIPTGATIYYYQVTGRASGLFSTELDVQMASGLNGVLRDLVVVTNATQPATGSLVITVRKNGANTALTVTIPANSPAGVYTDLTHTVTLTRGDLIDYSGQNNASTTATVITSMATTTYSQ